MAGIITPRMPEFSIRFKPVWRDQDALGHVNNAVYSTWLENAREAWWRSVAGEYTLFPFLLARTEIDFRAPVTWRDPIVLTVRVTKVGNSSFELTYSIDTEDARHVADAKTVLVMYDHEAKKTVTINDELRSKLNG
jgi:acyl-CoA thioester hydrolase